MPTTTAGLFGEHITFPFHIKHFRESIEGHWTRHPAMILPDTSSGPASEYNLFLSATGDVATYGKIGPGRDGTVYKMDGYRKRSGEDTHSIFADPRFVDSGRGNLALRPDSPAVDSGMDLWEKRTAMHSTPGAVLLPAAPARKRAA